MFPTKHGIVAVSSSKLINNASVSNGWFIVFNATFNNISEVVVSCHFQQYFSYIMSVSFIGGGNWSTWRKSLTNFIEYTSPSGKHVIYADFFKYKNLMH
jgi:hypothetical protein